MGPKEGLADAPDTPGQGVAERWEGVPLSGDMAAAMATVRTLSERYKLVPVSTGVLALALVADPYSGAARRSRTLTSSAARSDAVHTGETRRDSTRARAKAPCRGHWET